MAINYIVESSKPYPEWIKNHTVFKEMGKIDKIFPKIGLANFREKCEIINTDEATGAATRLGQQLTRYMQDAINTLYTKLEQELSSTAQNRNERCCEIQSTICLLQTVVYSLQRNDFVKVIDGKVAMRLRSDLFNGDKNPVFKKDESVLRVCGKIWDQLEKLNVRMAKIDQTEVFKNFSRVNVPCKEYMLCFSSHGEEGAWDIGTISMRGITSCQSWNAPQSRGLIGSIASKFVGVIYLESEKEKVPGYGTKMMNRAMVRFVINRHTKKPALIIDTMYPGYNKDTGAAFKKVLREKSGLEVLSINDPAENGKYVQVSDYYVPTETCSKLLKQGEASYADHPVTAQEHMSVVRSVPANLTALTDEFKKRVCADLDKMVNLKREQYVAAEKRIGELKTEYEAAKKKWEEKNVPNALVALAEHFKPEGMDRAEPEKFELEKPKMDEELAAFGKGGIMNLFTHMDKRHGKNGAASTFAKLILNNIKVADEAGCASKEEYHRKYLMSFLRAPGVVKEEAKKQFAIGSWMKSFPKSGDKFFEFVFSQMKPYMVASCKEMIRKSN